MSVGDVWRQPPDERRNHIVNEGGDLRVCRGAIAFKVDSLSNFNDLFDFLEL